MGWQDRKDDCMPSGTCPGGTMKGNPTNIGMPQSTMKGNPPNICMPSGVPKG
jgi:hypothetical protein